MISTPVLTPSDMPMVSNSHADCQHIIDWSQLRRWHDSRRTYILAGVRHRVWAQKLVCNNPGHVMSESVITKFYCSVILNTKKSHRNDEETARVTRVDGIYQRWYRRTAKRASGFNSAKSGTVLMSSAETTFNSSWSKVHKIAIGNLHIQKIHFNLNVARIHKLLKSNVTGRHWGPKRKLRAGYRALSLKQTSCVSSSSVKDVTFVIIGCGIARFLCAMRVFEVRA